ncbi:MAG: peptidoglycan-binding protein [Lachnospiraceae bacterium]|nr:peptidoglycan-binding protein [Lachnospiraceae bacterium]
MLLYNKDSFGRVLSGLVKRRQEERTLFLSTSGSSTVGGSIEMRPILKKGSKGSAVMELQRMLKVKGYDVGAIDGIFGSRTLAAVKAFQKANDLIVDGIVGAKTWEKLPS